MPGEVRRAVGFGYHDRMASSALDNPIWSALQSNQRAVAVTAGTAARYPADVAPFCAVAESTAEASAALASLLTPDEPALLIGVAPPFAGWRVDSTETLAQMTCVEPPRVPGGSEVVPLGAAQRADVLALIGLVYPHYFRPRTLELGRYFGIRRDGRLVAMAGERMATGPYTELSGICTHPDFVHRGYAHRLIAWLTCDLLAHGRQPFLHVSLANPAAQALYASLGYGVRRELPFWSLRRA